MELKLRVLGWDYSNDPEKDPPFSELFYALGVQYNLKSIGSGGTTVRNKDSRNKDSRIEEVGERC